jgi:hypothetical protein
MKHDLGSTIPIRTRPGCGTIDVRETLSKPLAVCSIAITLRSSRFWRKLAAFDLLSDVVPDPSKPLATRDQSAVKDSVAIVQSPLSSHTQERGHC